MVPGPEGDLCRQRVLPGTERGRESCTLIWASVAARAPAPMIRAYARLPGVGRPGWRGAAGGNGRAGCHPGPLPPLAPAPRGGLDRAALQAQVQPVQDAFGMLLDHDACCPD